MSEKGTPVSEKGRYPFRWRGEGSRQAHLLRGQKCLVPHFNSCSLPFNSCSILDLTSLPSREGYRKGTPSSEKVTPRAKRVPLGRKGDRSSGRGTPVSEKGTPVSEAVRKSRKGVIPFSPKPPRSCLTLPIGPEKAILPPRKVIPHPVHCPGLELANNPNIAEIPQ